MTESAESLFSYNKKNLQDACKLRGDNRARVLGELEFMRTHKFKPMPRKDNPSFGKWVERKKPIKKINVSCTKN